MNQLQRQNIRAIATYQGDGIYVAAIEISNVLIPMEKTSDLWWFNSRMRVINNVIGIYQHGDLYRGESLTDYIGYDNLKLITEKINICIQHIENRRLEENSMFDL